MSWNALEKNVKKLTISFLSRMPKISRPTRLFSLRGSKTIDIVNNEIQKEVVRELEATKSRAIIYLRGHPPF